MHKIYLILLLGLLTQLSTAQQQKSFSNALGIGFVISPEWNLYSWQQRPNNDQIALASGGNRSVGQGENVLPSGRVGLLFEIEYGRKTSKSTFSFLVEGGVSYMPFSFDLAERKGKGSLCFPIVTSLIFPLGYSEQAFFVGGGVQFSQIERSKRIDKYKDLKNPFFLTYVLELGYSPFYRDGGYGLIGIPKVFVRAGLGEYQAMTVDVGIRVLLGAYAYIYN
ncbi:MAG: hypothetical protein GY810_20530 [Aureispira sp.]|nr:hypothetical protein [Aureispira sp.]